MPVPPPLSDPFHIEQRLLLLAELLESAVAETRRVAKEIRSANPPVVKDTDGDDDARIAH